jgi:hypothetical protein
MSIPPSRRLGTSGTESATPTHDVLLSTPMPYVDLVSSDDYVSIWYTTNSRHNSVSTFDPTKPTIILLHPFSLDSSWLGHTLGDPRLDEVYNMIAFDLRFSGKTIERPNARLDCWVQAADLAFACEVCSAFSFVATTRFGVLEELTLKHANRRCTCLVRIYGPKRLFP